MLQRLPFLQRDNPIERAELLHQQRTFRKRRRRWLLIACIALFVVAGLISVYLFASSNFQQQTAASQLPVPRAARDVLRTTRDVLNLLVFIMYGLAFVQTMNLAASTVSREKEARTWESLILTNADAGRIVRGKWRATLRTIWWQYRYLLAVRVALTVLLWLSPQYFAISPYTPVDSVISFGLALLAVIAGTVLVIALAAAIGLLSSTAHRRSIVTLINGWAIYLILAFTLFGVIYLRLPGISMHSRYTALDVAAYQTATGWAFSVFDGGQMLMQQLLNSSSLVWAVGSSTSPHSELLMWFARFTIAPMVLFVPLTAVILRLAEYLLTRQNALPANSR